MKENCISKYNTPYSPEEKIKALKLLSHSTFEFVAHRYHCHIATLYRWRKQYDGTIESLKNGSHVPYTPNPRRHTDEELKHIQNLLRRHPNIGLNELYGKLRQNYGYARNPVSLYRLLKKKGYYLDSMKKKRKKYIPKEYHTPEHIGVKMQLDAKYVPKNCRTKNIIEDMQFYQYTMIDEATRERFIYAYQELNPENTVDFCKRAFAYYRYKPDIIQTDNGAEFTYTQQTKNDKLHPLDKLCLDIGIEHKKIKPRTPRHNGKVERSHRNDNERFYSTLRFYSYEDLLLQMKAYLKRSNNIPISVLKSSDGKRRWLTPMEKRKELLLLDWGVIE